MHKLTVLCDMDSIVTDLMQKVLDHYNRDHNDKVTKSDFKTWDIARNVKIGQDIYKYFYRDGFFLDLPAIPGAIEGLRAIQALGHHLVLVSAPSWPGTSASDKISWVKKHLPFINKRDIILGHNKHLIKGDIFIDDSPDNISDYREHWPHAKIMTISHPYNEEVKDVVDVFAESYLETEKAWGTIYRAIEDMR